MSLSRQNVKYVWICRVLCLGWYPPDNCKVFSLLVYHFYATKFLTYHYVIITMLRLLSQSRHMSELVQNFAYRENPHRRKGAERQIIDMVWLFSPYPADKFNYFLPASAAQRETGVSTLCAAPCIRFIIHLSVSRTVSAMPCLKLFHVKFGFLPIALRGLSLWPVFRNRIRWIRIAGLAKIDQYTEPTWTNKTRALL